MQLTLSNSFTQTEVLTHILVGLRVEASKLQARMEEVRQELNGAPVKRDLQAERSHRLTVSRMLKDKRAHHQQTPTARAAQSARMKAYWAARKRKKPVKAVAKKR